jgi:CDP-glucose 4,6-dehydratase
VGPGRGSLEGVVRQVTAGSWSQRRVLVTGATGIIGSWLVKELLRREAQVLALVLEDEPGSELCRSGDIDRVSVVHGALEDYPVLDGSLGEHGIDTVFHLGAQTIVGAAYRAPLPTFESNIRGTYNLLEACRVHADTVRSVVIASSDKAYGEQPVLPYTEKMTLSGQHPYDVSKSCADMLAQSYYRTYNLPVGIARVGNVYGGGDLNWSRIVPGSIRSILEGKRPVVRSDGTYERDYIYVKDVVDGYIRLAEGLSRDDVKGEAFNFGNEAPVTVLELVRQIQAALGGVDLEPEIVNTAEAEIRRQYLSASKARDVLCWQPRYDPELGLRETIDWYREFLAV